MRDTWGRKINYLRVSLTDLCNLRCQYCMPVEGVKKMKQDEILTLEEIYQVVKASVDLGVDKVRLTGGEPLVRKGIIKLITDIAKLPGVKDLALTTNGILLKEYARELKEAGLQRINISLDTLKPDRYKEITRGGSIEDVLHGLREARDVGLWPIKINSVVIGGFNDDEINDFAQLTLEGFDVRFIELMPIGQASGWAKSKFISNAVIKSKIHDLIPVYDSDKSSPAKYFKLPEAEGKVGFINPISSHFCKYCNRIRLTADGRLKPCLHSDEEIDIKTILRDTDMDLREVIGQSIMAKPNQHTLNDMNHKPIERDMVRIGG